MLEYHRRKPGDSHDDHFHRKKPQHKKSLKVVRLTIPETQKVLQKIYPELEEWDGARDLAGK